MSGNPKDGIRKDGTLSKWAKMPRKARHRVQCGMWTIDRSVIDAVRKLAEITNMSQSALVEKYLRLACGELVIPESNPSMSNLDPETNES
jgi:hypothetical protein